MLNEGTHNHTSAQIAEIFDFYGAYVDFTADKDFASANVFCLTKHVNPVLEIIYEILTDSIFPEEDLKILLANKKQEFTVSNQKVSNIAFRKFEQQLFGNQHPYGRKQLTEDYDTLQQADLVTFFKTNYKFELSQIIAAGYITDDVVKSINQLFGKSELG